MPLTYFNGKKRKLKKMNYSIVKEYGTREVSSVKVLGFASVNVVVFLEVFFFFILVTFFDFLEGFLLFYW